MSSTANRVIKNTGFLYAKMGITMFISLYTTRLILNSLGASDFGIFNIVGGAIAMLGFLNGAMASATQRFMSYSEGEGDKEKQKSIFNISFVLHLGISFVVGLALLIAGFFFFNGILNIPPDRVDAAKVVYGSLIVSTMFTVMTVPYDAAMNAHENMKYYAIVGIIESLLKLAVAFATVYTSLDKLVVYGILMACIPLVTLTIMRVYCHVHYEECVISPRRYWNKGLMKEMTSFAGWNFVSSMASIVTMQGTAIVLNFFWGVLANAAQGIANQLSGQIMVFSNTMLKALNPVIVKEEGAHSREKMIEASLMGNKFSYLMTVFFTIPFCIEAPFVLDFWLKETPEFAVVFCRLILIRLSLSQLSVTFGTAIGATGHIKYNIIVSSVIWVMMLPLSSLLYYWGSPAYTIYLVLIFMVILLLVNSLYFMKKECGLKVKLFFNKVLYPCFGVSLFTTLIGCIPLLVMEDSWTRFCLVGFLCIITFAVIFYTIALSSKEKQVVFSLVDKILRK